MRRWEIPLVVIFLLPAWRPDSIAPGGAALLALAWWLVFAPAAWWPAGVLGMFLAVLVISAAWSAGAPPWAAYAPGALRRRLIVFAAYLGGCALAIGVIGLIRAVAAGLGPIAVAAGVAALAVATAAAGMIALRRQG